MIPKGKTFPKFCEGCGNALKSFVRPSPRFDPMTGQPKHYDIWGCESGGYGHYRFIVERDGPVPA